MSKGLVAALAATLLLAGCAGSPPSSAPHHGKTTGRHLAPGRISVGTRQEATRPDTGAAF